MSPTGDCNDSNQVPTSSPGSVAATSKYSLDMIGYHIDKELYTSLENHLVHLILEEALAKAKKDDKIDQEKFKRLNEVVNKDDGASDIVSKLQKDDVKESFKELMDYVKGLGGAGGSEGAVSTSSIKTSDHIFEDISGFLSTVFQDVAAFVPFGALVFSIGKLGYKIFTSSRDLATEVQEFSGTISRATTSIKNHLSTQIHNEGTLNNMVINLNTLIESVVQYFQFYLKNYYKTASGKAFAMRNFNVLKTVNLKKDFEDIKKNFETANEKLTQSIHDALLNGVGSIGAGVENIQSDIREIKKVIGGYASQLVEVNHKYPLLISVLRYVDNDPREFEINEDCRVKNLIGMIAEEETIESKKVLLFHRGDRRTKLSNNTRLQSKLVAISNPLDTPIFDYATFVEVVIYEDGTTQEPIKIRLYVFTLQALKAEIELYMENLLRTRYTITASAPNETAKTPLDEDSLVEEFAFKSFDF
ncbi:UNVERIFIED_CONTAM: hypothetical protein HDU68_010943, partial [Siphonaria sp. JEL0065]